MELKVKQVSSLEKVRANDPLDHVEVRRRRVLAGERFSYQICVKTAGHMFAAVSVESELSRQIKLYQVRETYMDAPVTEDVPVEDYITQEPGYMPDVLIPLNGAVSGECTGESVPMTMTLSSKVTTVWVRVDVPRDIKPGSYSIKVTFTATGLGAKPVCSFCKEMTLEVIPAVMPEQRLFYTRWFYADCIAVAHNVEIYSEKHWELIGKYIEVAVDLGINMILVPIHTPPLDTEIGTTRPCVQLVDIEKKGDHYVFSFDKFRRFIALCREKGIQYFEMAHLFSQWGAKYAANIMVTENGKKDYLFGWHVAADSKEYTSFLRQYIKAIAGELEALGISENTWFHISDEPRAANLETYRRASELIRPLIGKSRTFDALSDYVFYEKGLVECPITYIEHIQEFLEHKIENQWAYYCSGPQKIFTNGLMAMPSCRTRILGLLLYKHDIKGFLHWGFNFYFSEQSLYPIDPYLTTSGDWAFPSGDPFIVYPGKDCVYPSIRGEVTYEAIQDIRLCAALEAYIGREAVVSLIDEAAGGDLRFDAYPRGKEFLERLREAMIEKIAVAAEAVSEGCSSAE